MSANITMGQAPAISRRTAIGAGLIGAAALAAVRLATPAEASAGGISQSWPYPPVESNSDNLTSTRLQASFHQAEARKLLALHNEHRASIGSPALTWSAELEELAKVRAVELAYVAAYDNSAVSWPDDHYGPTSISISCPSTYHGYGHSLAALRMFDDGFLWGVDANGNPLAPVYNPGMGENATSGAGNTAEKAMSNWLNSPGHKATLELNAYLSFGAACAQVGGQRFWITLFWNKPTYSTIAPAPVDCTELVEFPTFEANHEAWIAAGGLKYCGVVGEGQFGGEYCWPPKGQGGDSGEDQPGEDEAGEESGQNPGLECLPGLAGKLSVSVRDNGNIVVKKKAGASLGNIDELEAIAYRGTEQSNRYLGGFPITLVPRRPGTWKVWVRCRRGDEAGEWTSLGSFSCIPKPSRVPLREAVGGRGYIKASWTKRSTAGGYQVAYRKSGSKTWHYAKVSKLHSSKKIKKLSKGKYYVKVRAYCSADGKYSYGEWSMTMSCKVS